MFSDLLLLLQQSTAFYLTSVAFISLLIGSFLNVVIVRLPIMLEQVWRQESAEFLDIADSEQYSVSELSLWYPNSQCPSCSAAIRFYDNIPIISFMILRAKCRSCQKPISWRYPLIEALSAIAATIVAWHFGVSWQALAGIFLSYVLIVQSFIDLEYQIIPDEITLPVLWLGLLLAFNNTFNDLHSCVLGAVLGYLVLWVVYWLFWLVTKREGIGYGDFKLLAMVGAWFGAQALPFTILFSSIVGTLLGIIFLFATKQGRNTRIAFGPFLAIAAWLYMLWGNEFNTWYLQLSGLI